MDAIQLFHFVNSLQRHHIGDSNQAISLFYVPIEVFFIKSWVSNRWPGDPTASCA
jgi:hypothetical protein